MPSEVRSPGQVKWPNYKITFQSRHGYNVSGKVMKLSEYDEVISAYKMYISDFLYRWPQVRSFLRPHHYKSMGKKSTPLYLLCCKPIWVESYRIGQVWTIRVKICIAYPSKGHLRSPKVTNRHFPITFDQKRNRDVRMVLVRLSWPGESKDMQYDPFRSSRDLDLSVILYMVRGALTRQTRWYQIRCSTFKIKDFIVEKPFRKILKFWPLVTSILTWEKKMTEMISKWFFASFRTLPFVFLYGDQEPRSWGGAFKRPPPQQAVENPEAQQGAC